MVWTGRTISFVLSTRKWNCVASPFRKCRMTGERGTQPCKDALEKGSGTLVSILLGSITSHGLVVRQTNSRADRWASQQTHRLANTTQAELSKTIASKCSAPAAATVSTVRDCCRQRRSSSSSSALYHPRPIVYKRYR